MHYKHYYCTMCSCSTDWSGPHIVISILIHWRFRSHYSDIGQMRTYTCIRLSNDKTKNQSWMECEANHCLFLYLISWRICSLHQWSECQTTNNYVDVFPMLAVTLIPDQNIKLVTRVYWSTDNYSGGDWWCVPINQEGRTLLGRLGHMIECSLAQEWEGERKGSGATNHPCCLCLAGSPLSTGILCL